MAKRKRDETPESSEEEEGEEFEINVIDEVRCVADPNGSAWEYHVKWLGFESDDDTWEPHEGLEQTVPKLLERLWKEIDPTDEDKDYQIGDRLKPSDRWIRKELKESEKRWKEIQKERKRKEKRKAEKKAKRKRKQDSDEDEDEDEIAFAVSKEEGLHKDSERLRSQKKNKRGAFDHTRKLADELNEGAKSASDVGEASDGESDTPLASQVPKPASGPRFAKKKDNPYTLEPRAGPSRIPAKSAGTKRKVTGGRDMTVDSEDERPLTKTKKKRTIDISSAATSARASPAGSTEPVSAKVQGKGKAKAKAVVLSSSPEPARPATPPPASDADDGSLFGSSPQKAPPAPITTASAPPKGAARPSALATGSASAGPSAAGPAKRKSVQMLEQTYTDGVVLGTKAAVARKTIPKNPMAKIGFPNMKIPPLNKTGSKSGTPAGSPVIPQGPRSATGTPYIAQQSPVIPQQQPPAIAQHSPAGMSMSPPAQFMDVDQPMVASPIDASAEAEHFLQTEFQHLSPPPAPSAPSVHPGRPSMGAIKIPKKWKWEGEAFAHRGPMAESLARVIISDAMDPVPKGTRLSMVFRTTEGEVPLSSIKFEKLMGRSQMSKFFRPACKRPSHFARLSGSDSKDEKVLEGLARHMLTHDLGSYAFMDDTNGQPEALLLLIPSQRAAQWGFSQPGKDGKPMITISEELRRGPFFVAVCQWQASGEKISAWGTRPTDATRKRITGLRELIAPPDRVPKSTGITLRANPGLERARRILNLPQQLLKFLSDRVHPHPYAVWPYPSDGVATLQKVGTETTMLRDVIRAAHGQEVGLESTQIRVLFVHVGSIKSLAEVPSIVERRKQQLVQIFTYGTHHTVAPTQWGVREIYVYGGAVTFGPGLVKDAYGAARRIAEMADEHPMWTAFITPSVLALAAYEVYGESPLDVFDEHPERFPHRKLLELITSGRLSILRKPPTRVASVAADFKERDEWIKWQRDIVFGDERGVLEECLLWFNARYAREFEKADKADITEQRLRRFVLQELRTTVNAVMVQPSMIESARRFVVVLGEGEHAADTDKCGFEWETLSKFSFGDDFWREEDMAEMRQKLW
ncbi:hypothetical protein PENSPDRAFT_746691 [Peniophora sp. CONT]|nr:hypothetical protein PENSPDRAFT_746691 [Peniophora sp. CONT]